MWWSGQPAAKKPKIGQLAGGEESRGEIRFESPEDAKKALEMDGFLYDGSFPLSLALDPLSKDESRLYI